MSDLTSLTAILNEMANSENDVIQFPSLRRLRNWLEKSSGECYNDLIHNSDLKRLLSEFSEHLKELTTNDSGLSFKPIIKKQTDAVGMYRIKIFFDEKILDGMELFLSFRDGIDFDGKTFVGVTINDDFKRNLYNNRKMEKNFKTFDKTLEKEGQEILSKIRKNLMDTYIAKFKDVLKNPPKIAIDDKNFSIKSVNIPVKYSEITEMVQTANQVVKFRNEKELAQWLKESTEECCRSLERNSTLKAFLSEFCEHIKLMFKNASTPRGVRATYRIHKICNTFIDKSIENSILIDFDISRSCDMSVCLEFFAAPMFDNEPFIAISIRDDTIDKFNNSPFFRDVDESEEQKARKNLLEIRKILLDTYTKSFKTVMKNPPQFNVNHKNCSAKMLGMGSNVVIPIQFIETPDDGKSNGFFSRISKFWRK